MATFHFELVSPERLVFAGEVDQVDVPGEEGEFGVLAGHAPYIATLKPGMLKIYGASGASGASGAPQRIVVKGGFAEVGPTGLTVLAEEATPADQFDPAMIADAIKDAEEDVADAKSDVARDKARQRLEQLQTLGHVLAQ
jgi:F-type H+-transporting ATPase subunit epsilon